MKNPGKVLTISLLFCLPSLLMGKIISEEVIYSSSDGITCKGYVSYDDSKKEKMPVVLVVHEWWGCNDYARIRATKLAELGYLAFAVDMFGDGKTAADPKQASEFAGAFYSDPNLSLTRLKAGEAKAKSYPQSDTTRIAAIGYCFGGSMVLNGAKMNMDFDAVVSFHGGLQGLPAPTGLQSRMLICHGGDDKFVSEEEVKNFKADLDQSGANYLFMVYPGATHAFTNPAATETGKKFNLPISYNEAADKKSWEDMKLFFQTVLK